jgi:hypothetical protein
MHSIGNDWEEKMGSGPRGDAKSRPVADGWREKGEEMKLAQKTNGNTFWKVKLKVVV